MSVRTIQTDLNIKNKFKNKKIKELDFRYFNIRGFEFSKGGGQNFERRNVERLQFRNFTVANSKITKDELFDSFIIEFIFSFFRYYLNPQNIS